MKEFRLVVFPQSRILISILIFGASLASAAVIAGKIDLFLLKFIVPILMVIIVNSLSIYAAYGKITILSNDEKLSFRWDQKLIFNFSPIEDLFLKDIRSIVIQKYYSDPLNNTESLNQIIATDRSINLNTGLKYGKKDADQFIRYLKIYTRAEILDDWDVWKKKGFLKITYIITFSILILGGGFILWVVVSNGITNVEPQIWLYFVGAYLIMLRYLVMIKKKMN
jgi:hypothetical protein